MKIFKPKFWNKKNGFYSIILLPFSYIYLAIISLKRNISYPKKFRISVVCVGNIYIGGTGKTPLSIEIANKLILQKKRVTIIKKYYINHKDEHELIREKNGYLTLGNNRKVALTNASDKGFDIAILDDGFQDNSIHKNLNILCFSAKQLIGNGMVFPSGPLREKLESLKRADIIVINGDKEKEFEKKILSISSEINIFYSKYIPENIDKFKNKKLLAFAGIANPENFFNLLSHYNIDVKKSYSFPDHYNFSKPELEKLFKEAQKNNYGVITTEKDYHRIKSYGFEDLNYLKLKLVISNEDKFINLILNSTK